MFAKISMVSVLAACALSQDLLRKERETSRHVHIDMEGEVNPRMDRSIIMVSRAHGEAVVDQRSHGETAVNRSAKRRSWIGRTCSHFNGMTDLGDVSNTDDGLGYSGGADGFTGCGSRDTSNGGTKEVCELSYETNNGGKFQCVWDNGICRGYRDGGDFACRCPDVEPASGNACKPILNVYDTEEATTCSGHSQTDCDDKYYLYHDMGLNIKCAWDSSTGSCKGIDYDKAIVACCYAGFTTPSPGR